MFFVGEYEHALDPKQRLAIPAEIRDQLKPEVHGDAFVAAPGANGSLWLWPEKVFEELSGSLGGSFLGDEDMQQFERLMFSQAARVTVDGSGRVRIPDRLLEDFGLAGNVMILGVRDHLELVEPNAWKEEQKKLRPAQADVWRRARQVMGEKRKSQS